MTVSVLRTESARDDQKQNVQYLYKPVTHLTPLIQNSTGKIVYVGVLPAYSLKMETIVRINTSFDGTLTIGTSTSQTVFASSNDVQSSAPPETYVADAGYGFRSTVDTPVYVTLTTGTTIGGADIWISYLKGTPGGSTA